MNYHPDDFLALIEDVEAQGGSHLNEVCKPRGFRMNLPIDDENPKGPKASRTVHTAGCHRRAKFLVPLLPEAHFGFHNPTDTVVAASIDKKDNITYRAATGDDFDFDDSENPTATMNDGSPALAKVCAVDDAMGLWPRFAQTMHTGESFQE